MKRSSQEGKPAGLKDLKLVNTTLIHHHDMRLPAGLHLDSLTACMQGKGTNVLPVELLKRTKQVGAYPVNHVSQGPI